MAETSRDLAQGIIEARKDIFLGISQLTKEKKKKIVPNLNPIFTNIYSHFTAKMVQN